MSSHVSPDVVNLGCPGQSYARTDEGQTSFAWKDCSFHSTAGPLPVFSNGCLWKAGFGQLWMRSHSWNKVILIERLQKKQKHGWKNRKLNMNRKQMIQFSCFCGHHQWSTENLWEQLEADAQGQKGGWYSIVRNDIGRITCDWELRDKQLCSISNKCVGKNLAVE